MVKNGLIITIWDNVLYVSGKDVFTPRHLEVLLTTLSSDTSVWIRGAAQMSVDTASCKPGSSSLIKTDSQNIVIMDTFTQ